MLDINSEHNKNLRKITVRRVRCVGIVENL